MKKLYLLLVAIVMVTWAHAQITLVEDINPGTGNSSPMNLFVYNNYVYFGASDANATTNHGRELWRTNGSVTELVKDIRTGTSSSSPGNFFTHNNTLYFSANAGSGSYIFSTDGTETGTVDLGLYTGVFFPLTLNNAVYFINTTGGNTLYQFNTSSVSAVNTSSVIENISGGVYTSLNNKLILYMRTDVDNDTYGRELYEYDFSSSSFKLIKDVVEGASSASINYMVTIGQKVYFEAADQLWETDGTADGTILVDAASSLTTVKYFFAWNNELYFNGTNGTDGTQLYVYKPNSGTLTNLSNISGKDHNPDNFVVCGDYLYYSGEDADGTDDHLFRTNGSTIEEIDNTIIDVDDIVNLNGVLYFEAEDPTGDATTGNELFSYTPSDDMANAVESTIDQSNIRIYPNPSKGTIYVDGLSGDANYSLTNISGTIVKSGLLSSRTLTFDVAPGIYVIQIKDNETTLVQKLIIK